MKAFIIIIMACNSLAHYTQQSETPNVGTVLYTTSDLKKKHWSKTDISLLQARKYLQNVIPPSQFMSTIDEDYLRNFLSYFENCYLTVKREINEPSIRNIMDVAMSDALGGYLKVWVLPITKYAYYGGTVSLNNAVKIFEAYEDIKRSLHTDGHGWHSPNENLLNSVAINVASIPKFPKKHSDACKQLAYYEKTDGGMKIPLPCINWNISPPTMFVPLANESIVPLSSPSSSSTLLKYYSIADDCIHMYPNPTTDDFYNRFQMWLETDVTPHLNDDKLYAAFGGILSLINATKIFYDEKLKEKVILLRHPMEITSKKFLVIALILIIELIWCIPTIIYILRSERNKRKEKKGKNFESPKCIKKVFARKEKRCCPPPPKPKPPKSKPKLKKAKSKAKYCYHVIKEGDEFAQFANTENKTSSKTGNTAFSNEYYDLMTLINEKPSSKTIFPEFNTTKTLIDHYKTKCDTQSKNIKSKTNIEKMQQLQLPNKKNTNNDGIETLHKNINLFDKDSSNCKCSVIEGNRKITCISCKQKQQNDKRDKIIENLCKPKSGVLNTEERQKNNMNTIAMYALTEEKPENSRKTVEKIEHIGKKELKVESDRPMLQILIERPNTSINVGITNYRESTSVSSVKPSKIPRAVRSGKETDNCVSKTNGLDLIDQDNNITNELVVTGKALDDTAIKQASNVNNKLNSSF